MVDRVQFINELKREYPDILITKQPNELSYVDWFLIETSICKTNRRDFLNKIQLIKVTLAVEEYGERYLDWLRHAQLRCTLDELYKTPSGQNITKMLDLIKNEITACDTLLITPRIYDEIIYLRQFADELKKIPIKNIEIDCSLFNS